MAKIDGIETVIGNAIVGRLERLPTGHGPACGSSAAHGACKFAGPIDGLIHACAADGSWRTECPYTAAGFISVFEVVR